jgi:superfamily II DNA or RNA helicase
MAYLVENSKRNDFIVKLCGETQGNTLVLFNYVEKHGKPLYELIQKQYPEKKVYFISGKVDAENREFIRKIIDKEKNAILVASFGTTSTGINIVHLDNIIFASPTKSVIRLLQSIGRGLRTSAIKQTLKVFDIVDDMSWKSYKNHVLKHFEQRIKIYKKEKFDHKVFKIKI